MRKLNITKKAGDPLSARNINDIVDKTNEIVDSANRVAEQAAVAEEKAEQAATSAASAATSATAIRLALDNIKGGEDLPASTTAQVLENSGKIAELKDEVFGGKIDVDVDYTFSPYRLNQNGEIVDSSEGCHIVELSTVPSRFVRIKREGSSNDYTLLWGLIRGDEKMAFARGETLSNEPVDIIINLDDYPYATKLMVCIAYSTRLSITAITDGPTLRESIENDLKTLHEGQDCIDDLLDIDKTEVRSYTQRDIEFQRGYVNVTGKKVGDTIEISSSSIHQYSRIEVPNGCIGFDIYTKLSGSHGTMTPFAVVDEDNLIMLFDSSRDNFDSLNNKLTVDLSSISGAAYIYVVCLTSELSRLEIDFDVKKPNLKETVADNTDKIKYLSNKVSKLNTTYLPRMTYGIVGETMQMFTRGIVCAVNPYNNYSNFVCEEGKVFDRYFEITPSAEKDYVLKHSIISDDYTESEEKTTIIKSVRKPSNTKRVNILCVGSSTTANSLAYPVELSRRLTTTGGSPSGDGYSNVRFVGRKNVQDSNVKCEATGGWTWNSFNNAGSTNIRLVLTNVGTLVVGTKYKIQATNGVMVTIVVAENYTASGVLFTFETASQSSFDINASGTITKESGSGDESIMYSSCDKESGNPFWNRQTSSLDFRSYADRYCDGNIDIMIINLTPLNNSVLGLDPLDRVMSTARTFIDALHSQLPNCKVVFHSGNVYNVHRGLEWNNGASSKINQWSATTMIFRYNQAIDDMCYEDKYKGFCYHANVINELDAEYAYPTSQRPVNTRMTDVTEYYGTNGAHPTSVGYKMVADVIYRCLVSVIVAHFVE